MTNRIDFPSLTPPKTPNWCLAAPKGLCPKAVPQIETPVFPVAPGVLWDRVLKAVAAEPRITVHEQDKAAHYFDFTQTSMLFRFPDRVTLQIFPADAGGAKIAIFSRSKYGRSDLGVNAKRVKRLLAALERSGAVG
jgi:uncharacterized protein (DUF1499 family)